MGHFDDFPKNRWRVSYDGKVDLDDFSTEPPKGAPSKEECEEKLAKKIVGGGVHMWSPDDPDDVAR